MLFWFPGGGHVMLQACIDGEEFAQNSFMPPILYIATVYLALYSGSNKTS